VSRKAHYESFEYPNESTSDVIDYDLGLSRNLDRFSRIKPAIGIWSYKTNSYQYAESLLEVTAFIGRELTLPIAAQLTQPESIGIPYQGNLIRYTTDGLIKSEDCSFYYEEVKPAQILEDRKFMKKFEYYQAYFDDVIGVPLVLNTARSEYDWPDFTVLNNEIIYPALDHHIDEVTLQKILNEPLGDVTTLLILEDVVRDYGLYVEAAITLLANQHFTYSNDSLINRFSEIEVASYVS